MSNVTSDGLLARVVATGSGSSIIYQAIALVLGAFLLRWIFSKPGDPLKFPKYGPLEIALTGYVISLGGPTQRLYSKFSQYGGSLFGLSQRHQVIVDLPNVDRFLSQGVHALQHLPGQLSLMFRVFGATESPQVKKEIHATIKDLMSVVEKEFLNDVSSTAAMQRGDVQHKITSLVSFHDSKEHMQPWERSANVRLIPAAGSAQAAGVEVDFQSIVRDFGASIAIPVLYGKDFMERNPDILADFWKFDNDGFPLLIIGIPPWAPFKMMRDGVAARTRLLEALEALYRRLDQYQKGQPVDFGADVSDVGIAFGRNAIYDRNDVPMKHRAELDMPFFWGQNANTQPLLFWFLTFVYSTPGLVDELRKEIAPWVKLSSAGPVQIEAMDISALNRECPMMKSALYETFRLASDPTSIRYVAKPLAVVDGDKKHQLQPGTFISAALALTQRDPDIYPDPDKFIPDRFLEVETDTGAKTARYGRLRPWGVGHGSCKGRTFAEKEIFTIAAAMMSVWEVEPAGGVWNVPAMIPGTGAKKPVHDIRVIFRRRVV